MHGVALTGMGPVSVAGVGTEAFRAGLAGPADMDRGGVGPLNLAEKLKSAKTYLDRNSQLGLLAASLALEEAGLVTLAVDPATVGVSFGTAWGNAQTQEMFLTGMAQKGPRLASPLLFIHSYPNTTSSLALIEWGLKGRALNFCTGRSAGMEALLAAVTTVADGSATIMLAGASDAGEGDLGPANQGPRFREGAGFVVLETEESAHAREAVVYGRIRGWSRGRETTTAIGEALDRAGLKTGSIDALVLDGPDTQWRTHVEQAIGKPGLDLSAFTGETCSAGAILATIAATLGTAGARNVMVVSGGVFDAAMVITGEQAQ